MWHAALFGLALAMAVPATADEVNQKTIFTFSDAVQIPGHTLPAGKYTFQLPNFSSSRDVVQVFNEDGTKLITMLLTVSAERLDAADEPMVMFGERSQNQSPAVQYWFYPGRRFGHEFVYPRQQATQIAKASGKAVLATDAASNDASTLKGGKIVSIDPEGKESEYSERQAHNDNEPRAMTSTDSRDTAPTQTTPSMQGTDDQSASRSSVQTAQSAQTTDTDLTRNSSMRAQSSSAQSTNASTQQTRRRLPQTASGDSMILLLAVSSFLGLSAIGGTFRRQ